MPPFLRVLKISLIPWDEVGKVHIWALFLACSNKGSKKLFLGGRYMATKSPNCSPKRAAKICAPISQQPKWGDKMMTPWPFSRASWMHDSPLQDTRERRSSALGLHHAQGNSATMAPVFMSARKRVARSKLAKSACWPKALR